MDPLRLVSGSGSVSGAAAPVRGVSAGGARFADILKAKLEGVKWSGHAQERLRSRGISLTDRDRALVDGALRKAAEKGSRNSLFLLRDVGFVVSVENRTVVTAVEKAELKERVFTDIDSTVILE